MATLEWRAPLRYPGLMSYAAIEVEWHDGHLVARGSEPLPRSGAGLLVILSETAMGGGGWRAALAEIRARQAARGHSPRTPEAVAEQLRQERESWT
jgi:hypothetical protein